MRLTNCVLENSTVSSLLWQLRQIGSYALKITREIIDHIASLARVDVDENNVASIEKDLSEIMQFFEKLRELDTEGVSYAEFSHLSAEQVRNDTPVAGLGSEVAMNLAPEKLDSFFKAPPVME